ncbi:hypothetical protein [Mycoplasma parvum]|uniref:Uncharacterized protein n=1 Tax=Mycoplasma parvum str. Indiana TaxID=1403316 RepID=U5NFG0_9MOLU|nr:hypothetical protein [Mycoplasma parvum]AGX88958.1 hypothetical protein PRV_00965 [Mycoplasma parvum str. Indiana]
MEEYLSLSKGKSIKEKDVVITEESKNGNEKKVSLENGLNVTVTRYKEDRDYKNRIKVGINCMDGDLIGWGNDFLDKNLNSNVGWDKFQHTFEKGLKGYLNLIFGCGYRAAIEEAAYGKWWNTKELGNKLEEIAMVGIVPRIGGEKNDEELIRVSENQKFRESTYFNEIWNLFRGVKPRSSQSRTSITNTAAEIWIYNRNEFGNTYRPKIQKLVRGSIANSLINLVLGATWCNQKILKDGKWYCEGDHKYEFSEIFKKDFIQYGKFENLRLDGSSLALPWNPQRPTWMWNELKKWNLESNKKQWWNKVKGYLKDISKSSWFYNQNEEIAKILCYEIFKNLIGQEKLQFIKSREKWCKVGWNGIMCPNSGVMWQK